MSASKNWSEMVLYLKRTYAYLSSEDTGPIKFRSLVLEILQKL